MARIRKCTHNSSNQKIVYIICHCDSEIAYWDPKKETWVDGQTSKRKGKGRYHRMYEEGKKSSPLEFMIDTGHTVPRELLMKTD